MLSAEFSARGLPVLNKVSLKKLTSKGATFLLGQSVLMVSANPQLAAAAEIIKPEPVYEVGELFELSIQLSYLLLLLGLLGVGTFYVIRQVLVRRELDLSAKELQVLNSKLVSYICTKLWGGQNSGRTKTPLYL